MANSIPNAKNILRRALSEIIDKSPTKAQKTLLYNTFGNHCAYCGIYITDKKRRHLDHLVSVAHGGANHCSNRVLSCATCNESEKKDMPWLEFLRLKSEDAHIFQHRKTEIEKWIALWHLIEDQELALLVKEAEKRIYQAIDTEVEVLRLAIKAKQNITKTFIYNASY
jgi:hypothetical protein